MPGCLLWGEEVELWDYVFCVIALLAFPPVCGREGWMYLSPHPGFEHTCDFLLRRWQYQGPQTHLCSFPCFLDVDTLAWFSVLNDESRTGPQSRDARGKSSTNPPLWWTQARQILTGLYVQRAVFEWVGLTLGPLDTDYSFHNCYNWQMGELDSRSSERYRKGIRVFPRLRFSFCVQSRWESRSDTEHHRRFAAPGGCHHPLPTVETH